VNEAAVNGAQALSGPPGMSAIRSLTGYSGHRAIEVLSTVRGALQPEVRF